MRDQFRHLLFPFAGEKCRRGFLNWITRPVEFGAVAPRPELVKRDFFPFASAANQRFGDDRIGTADTGESTVF